MAIALSAIGRGSVHLVQLDPTLGREIRKTRPRVVVSPDELNDHLRTVDSWQQNFGPNFAPLTPKHHRKPGNTRDQRARRINNLANPAKSAKPRSPVQIRAPPPILSLINAGTSERRIFQLSR